LTEVVRKSILGLGLGSTAAGGETIRDRRFRRALFIAVSVTVAERPRISDKTKECSIPGVLSCIPLV